MYKNVRNCTDLCTDGMYGNVRMIFEILVATLQVITLIFIIEMDDRNTKI